MYRQHGWIGRSDRFPVEIDAVAHRGDGSSVKVTLTNVSDQGCRVETAHPFGIGEQLRIAIPRMGQLTAQVRWALPDSAGMRFVSESDF